MKSIVTAFLVVFIFFAFDSKAVTDPLRILSPNEPPVSYVNSQGKSDGYLVDITQAIQAELADMATISFVPEARALNLLEKKPNILFIGLSKTKFRTDKYHWPAKVSVKNWQVFTHNQPTLTIDSTDELKALRTLGVVRGDVREEWLINRNFTNLYSVTNPLQSIRLLIKGRVSAIAYDQQGVRYLCQEYALECSLLNTVYTLSSSDVYLIMSKMTDDETVTLWREAYENLLARGVIENIAKKWQKKLHQQYGILSSVQDGILVF